MKNELFENGCAQIEIPNKEIEFQKEIKILETQINELSKENLAITSFYGTVILDNEEKIILSKMVHPNKKIKFNLLFSTKLDGTDSSSNFHINCDGVFPTLAIILDTSERKFGGYSTQNWCPSNSGEAYSRAPGSFIFNITNKEKSGKYNLIDELNKNSIYRGKSNGPTFGGQHDLYISNSCKSNSNSYCYKSSSSSYNTGNNNLLGNSGQTSFQVKEYEVYQVVFE